MATQPTNPQEEIDLGSLFSQLGKMFKGIFNAFKGLFTSSFHYSILFLLFLRKNIIVLGVSSLIGGVLGYILQNKKETTYNSKMFIETNYLSANRLYGQIDYLNNLIKEEDSLKVAKIFNISPATAAQLTGFTIQASEPLKQSLLDYDTYMQETDTIYTRGFEFQDFQKRLSEKDLRYHIITANSKVSTDFENLKIGIIALVENDYYKKMKEVKLEELHFAKQELETNIYQLDSLRKQYKTVALLQAAKGVTADVNFSATSKKEKNYDMDLYRMSSSLLRQLAKINKELAEHQEIIKIRSDFSKGVENNSLTSKDWFKYGIFGFLLAFFVLVGVKFNNYLGTYKTQKA